MNLAVFTLLDLRRVIADRAALFFSIALPVLFYLLFGAMQSSADIPIHDGNVAAYVMIGMGLYGGVVAACATAGTTAVEQATGWGRQLALTPLTPWQLLSSKAVTVLVRAALPVAAVNVAGLFTDASLPLGQRLAAAALSVLVALPFGFYGMAFGLLFRSESAVSISSTALVVLAFCGNLFMPLPQALLAWARFTPMYGAAAVARYPMTQGTQAVSDGTYLVQDPLWYGVVNVLAWTLVFVLACVLLGRREKGRR